MKIILGLCLIACFIGCDVPVQSASGVKMAKVGDLAVDASGHTAEQNNIIHKIKVEADPNKIWYLYVLSPATGKTIMTSTIKGKITSSGKRLTPKSLGQQGMAFQVGTSTLYTDEMPSEDGAYGDSAEYIYWTDAKGVERRHYMLDGQIITVADKQLTSADLHE